MGAWKARLGMLWKCAGVLWLSLLNKPSSRSGWETFPFYPWRGGTTYTALCSSPSVKLIFGVVLLIVSRGEDSWIFLGSWRKCFTHPFPCPVKEKKKVKPYNLVCCERCSHPAWPGNAFSFPPSCTQPVSVSLPCVRISCMIPSAQFYRGAASRKSAPEFTFACTKRINSPLNRKSLFQSQLMLWQNPCSYTRTVTHCPGLTWWKHILPQMALQAFLT